MASHGGDVRCGRCAKVFNAHAYLEQKPEELSEHPPEASGNPEQAPFRVCCSASAEYNHGEGPCDLTIAPSPQPAPTGEEGAVTAEVEAPSLEEAKVEEEIVQLPQAVVLPEPQAEAENSIQERSEEALPEPSAAAELLAPEPVEPAAVEPTALAPQLVPEQPVVPDVFVEPEPEPKNRRFFWLWLIGALLLMASMGVQGLYYFRSDLAASHPEFKPFLQQFCGVLRCSIRLPANPDLLSIETSNLEADPQQANLVALNAILRNRAKLAQEYPQLELTLTDIQDKMIARRIFAPGEYAKSADLKRGMAPNEEVTVKLSLDLGDLKAAGYRVFLFYPQ